MDVISDTLFVIITSLTSQLTIIFAFPTKSPPVTDIIKLDTNKPLSNNFIIPLLLMTFEEMICRRKH